MAEMNPSPEVVAGNLCSNTDRITGCPNRSSFRQKDSRLESTNFVMTSPSPLVPQKVKGFTDKEVVAKNSLTSVDNSCPFESDFTRKKKHWGRYSGCARFI